MNVDVVVIGSGPNGLAAAIELAREGVAVQVYEAGDTPGGGLRTRELTLPGFHHDVCSACHPMGILSPFLKTLPLHEHGLEWLHPTASVAHPLDDQPAVMLRGTVDETAAGLGVDGDAYRRLLTPLVEAGDALFSDALGPASLPAHPLVMANFGRHAWRSATSLARSWFREERTHALLAGCAAHATQPLENPLTAAMTLMFLVSGHRTAWPVARGGSGSIARAMVSYLRELGGEVVCGRRVRSLNELPDCKAVLFDTSPDQLARLGREHLPSGFVKRLEGYRYGPGSFKLDWALDGPIPWADPAVALASTVHLGGTMPAIARHEREVFAGRETSDPYVLLVQQSEIDPGRAPSGKHTGYAYMHVPNRSTVDHTDALESQVERFAPGFKERILARHVTGPADFHTYNLNYVGGAVTGGVADVTQLFTRPSWRAHDPYSTPNPRLFIGSASTPPGGGVHGMCGYHAARSMIRRLPGLESSSWS